MRRIKHLHSWVKVAQIRTVYSRGTCTLQPGIADWYVQNKAEAGHVFVLRWANPPPPQIDRLAQYLWKRTWTSPKLVFVLQVKQLSWTRLNSHRALGSRGIFWHSIRGVPLSNLSQDTCCPEVRTIVILLSRYSALKWATTTSFPVL